MKSWRQRVFVWLEPGEQASPWEQVFDFAVLVLILLSVVVVVLQSMPEMAEYDGGLMTVEKVCVYFFTVEYLVRLWTCPEVALRGRMAGTASLRVQPDGAGGFSSNSAVLSDSVR